MDLALSCLAFCPFVSICNVWGQKPVYLLQIETFVGGSSGGDGPFVRCGGDGSV